MDTSGRSWSGAPTLLFVALVATVGAHAQAAGPDTVFGVFATSHHTPHVAWAKPYVRGTLKVLVIAPSYMQRESVELWQRLDCDVYPLMTFKIDKIATYPLKEKAGVYGLGAVTGETVDRLIEHTLERAGDWDVAIVGRFRWVAMPSDMRLALLLAVRERGAGLVLVEQDLEGELASLLRREATGHDRYFTNVIPWSDLPAFRHRTATRPNVRLARFGKGRVVALNYHQRGMGTQPHTRHGLTPGAYRGALVYRPHSPDYDYCMSLVVRSVLWAGRREARARFRYVTLPLVEIERAKLQTPTTLFVPWPTGAPRQHWWLRERAAIRFAVAGADRASVAWTIRNRWNEVEARGRIARIRMEPMIGACLELPVLAGGRHYLEAFLKQDGKTADWAIVPFDVSAECPAPRVAMDKPSFDRGKDVTGRVVLDGDLPEGTAVAIQIWDSLGRLLAERAPTGTGAVRTFRFTGLDPLTQTYFAKAVLTDKRGVVATGRSEFLIPRRGSADYQLHAWHTPNAEPITGHFLDRLRDLGVDAIMPCHLWVTPAELVAHSWQCARHDLRIFPYLESMCGFGLTAAHNKKGEPVTTTKRPCFLHDRETTCAGLYSRLRGRARLYAPFAPQGVMLSEEDGFDFKKTDRCFCANCQASFRRYLEDAYGTIAALNRSWGTNYTDWSQCRPITFADAKKRKQFPRWVDHRMHMMTLWTDYHLAMPAHVARGDARVESVFFGDNEEPYYGADIFRLYSRYGRVFGLTDYAPRGVCQAPGYGTYAGHGVAELRLNPWRFLASGANGAQYFTIADGRPTQGGSQVLSASFETVVDHFAATMASTREVQRGPGRLIIGSKRADDRVRLLDSPASMMASHYSHAETPWRDSRADFERALRTAGIFHRRIASRQLERKALEFPRVKVLILPFCQAISPTESRHILAFARAGGTVVADFAPGVMDEHGCRLKRAPLAGLFPNRKAMAVTRLGKGRGVYLGKLLRGCREAGVGPWLEAFLRVLAEADVAPRVRVQPADGPTTYAVQARLFEDGRARYLFLFHGAGGTVSAAPWTEKETTRQGQRRVREEFVVRLRRPAEVYDARSGKHVATGSTFTAAMSPDEVTLLALMPYKVEGMTVGTTRVGARRFSVKATLRVTGAQAGRHVFRLRLFGPEGHDVRCFARNVEAPGGTYEATLPLALNDPAGTYTFRFRDVATGVTGKAQVKMR